MEIRTAAMILALCHTLIACGGGGGNSGTNDNSADNGNTETSDSSGDSGNTETDNSNGTNDSNGDSDSGSDVTEPTDDTTTPNPIDNAPQVSAGDNQTVTSGNVVTLAATVVDEGSPNISWVQTSGSPDIVLSSTSTSTITFTAPEVSTTTTYTFSVSADDGVNAAVSDSITITVNPQTVGLRSMQAELDFIQAKATSLTQNDKGYWEADFGNGLVMIYVPGGSFTMGNNDLIPNDALSSSPEHSVTLDHYWISKTMVTTGQFRTFIAATSYVTDVEKATNEDYGCYVYDIAKEAYIPKLGYKWDNAYRDIQERHPEITIDDSHPVSCVSWNDSIAYTNQLKSQYGLEFTLPTEAEWEYAARGTDGRIYPWGNETPDGTRANYADETFYKYFPNLEQAVVHFGVDDGYPVTSPVGSFPAGASPIGALDMAANLTEWVFDSEYDYTASSKVNPIHNNTSVDVRLQKGGFWSASAGRVGVSPDEINDGHNIRSDARQGDTPAIPDDHLGFRVAISYTDRD
jgi:formylglycine-generating enzyme required for sulfatase activity